MSKDLISSVKNLENSSTPTNPSTERRELLLGCGFRRDKLIVPPGGIKEWRGLVTVDVNPNCKPDFVFDLNRRLWAFATLRAYTQEEIRSYDEIHAYEVLEHLGKQGDYQQFFSHFSEIWYLLKPGGYFCATVPSRYSPWLWGDPGHTRAILPETLTFLDQTSYYAGPEHSPMTDYRGIYSADFNIIQSTDDKVFHRFILQSVNPSRKK